VKEIQVNLHQFYTASIGGTPTERQAKTIRQFDTSSARPVVEFEDNTANGHNEEAKSEALGLLEDLTKVPEMRKK
jgi:hypothetical protein